MGRIYYGHCIFMAFWNNFVFVHIIQSLFWDSKELKFKDYKKCSVENIFLDNMNIYILRVKFFFIILLLIVRPFKV